MYFESLDLEVEAIRYRDAFGLDKTATYEFRPDPKLPSRPEIDFECIISDGGRMFGLSTNVKWTLISLDRDDNIEFPPDQFEYGHSEILDKGLFNMGLLTHEIETALQMSVSAHQKLEWKLEFEKIHNSANEETVG